MKLCSICGREGTRGFTQVRPWRFQCSSHTACNRRRVERQNVRRAEEQRAVEALGDVLRAKLTDDEKALLSRCLGTGPSHRLPYSEVPREDELRSMLHTVLNQA